MAFGLANSNGARSNAARRRSTCRMTSTTAAASKLLETPVAWYKRSMQESHPGGSSAGLAGPTDAPLGDFEPRRDRYIDADNLA